MEPAIGEKHSRQLLEVASWRVATEVQRRYPSRLTIRETHPGGGQYDCLTLLDLGGADGLVNLNRLGRAHVLARFDAQEPGEPWDIWSDLVAADAPRAVVDELCRRAGLPPHGSIPPTGHQSLMYRVIAAFLTAAVFGRQDWECRSGYLDTTGYGAGVRQSLLDSFPQVGERVLASAEPELEAMATWFLLRDGEGVAAFHESGLMWRKDDRRCQLMGSYVAERRVWPVVTAVLGDLLS